MAMDLSKSYEYFQPEKVEARINIVGCGSVGATLAENLVRLGITNLALWDMDVVNPPSGYWPPQSGGSGRYLV